MSEILSKDIWDKLKSTLKDQLNPQSFNVWFAPTKALSIENNTLNIEVPNKFFKDWLEEHYREVVSRTLNALAGQGVEVVYIINNNKPVWIDDVPPKNAPQIKEKISGLGALNPKYTFDNFVVGPSNRFAHAASLAVSERPAEAYNPLFLYGGVGLGKTHLMQAISHHVLTKNPQLKVLYISSEKFTNQLIDAIQKGTTLKFREKYRNVDVLLVDDIHFIAGKQSTQEEFFHTFNALRDAHKQIVISSDRPPKEISTLEERLVSRFEGGLITDIQTPDFETRIAILRKKAEKEVINVPNDVTSFIAEKIATNIRELEGALIRVVAYALLVGEEVTLDLTKEVLKETLAAGQEKRITIDIIQKKVAEHFDVRISDMKIKKRTKAVAFPRQIAMYLSRELTDSSLPDIGEAFGGKDHTTVLHAHKKITKLITDDVDKRALIDRITSELKRG
jgi:chromosomal replication initiator protein